MPRRFVDLSIYLENDVLSDPPAFAPKIQYFTHESHFLTLLNLIAYKDSNN